MAPRFLFAILFVLSLIAQTLAVQPRPDRKLPVTAVVIPTLVSRAVRMANGPRVNIQLRRGWDDDDFSDPDQIIPPQKIRRIC
ncbi:hypothetical protein T484DRAFT_1832523 [Baffinella frigidus]|nr:hypothetical protein T484DRAFT_1832523 [Cryptophyta sp. CCMP2293]